jgi:hypothetical protein
MTVSESENDTMSDSECDTSSGYNRGEYFDCDGVSPTFESPTTCSSLTVTTFNCFKGGEWTMDNISHGTRKIELKTRASILMRLPENDTVTALPCASALCSALECPQC